MLVAAWGRFMVGPPTGHSIPLDIGSLPRHNALVSRLGSQPHLHSTRRESSNLAANSIVPGQIVLRPVALPDDEPFLRRLYASTREEELAPVGWSAAQREAFLSFQFAAQQRHYQSCFPRCEHCLVLLAGEPIGRLYTEPEN